MKKQVLILLVISILFCNLLNSFSIGVSETIQKDNDLNYQGRISDLIFDLYIKLLMKIGHKPSIASCIIKDDRVVWSKTYGLYDIEN